MAAELFTRAEVAELISLALGTADENVAYRAGYEAGYWAGVEQENATYPPPKVLTFGRWYDQALEREKADAEVRRLVAEERGR